MALKSIWKLVLVLFLVQACGSDTVYRTGGAAGTGGSQDARGDKQNPEDSIVKRDQEFYDLLRNAENSSLDAPSIDINNPDFLAGFAKLLELLGNKTNLDIDALLTKIKEIFPDLDKIGGLEGVNKVIVVYAMTVKIAEENGQLPKATYSQNNIPILDIIAIVKVVINIISIFSDPNSGIGDLIDMIKNGDLSKMIDLIKLLIGGKYTPMSAEGQLQINPLQDLPDFAKLLGIDNIKDFTQLKAMFQAHVKHVLNNFDGPVKDALISMLKLGYGQAYQNLK